MSQTDPPVIDVQELTKVYRVPQREAGLGASVKSLMKRAYRDVEAVRAISFCIEPGEVVGFIGPNGAGKTTTLKLLSGLLYPTSGQARVLGFTPSERRTEYLRRISMVLGNKSQMLWDIPPLDTFQVLAEIYGLNRSAYHKTLDELVDLLKMQDLLKKPVRNLSLGERMKCELVAGLLHRPAVMFLDEPTLGLDVSMQRRLRTFLADYNRREGVSMLLTSHYMADVMALCPRVILIHEGSLLYDGVLSGLAQRLAPFKLLKLALNQDSSQSLDLRLSGTAEILERQNGVLTLRVSRSEAPALAADLLNTLPVADLTIEDPPLEAVIDQIYQAGGV
jgi:ABC-2 type transport system ATP-binding protein